MNENEMNEIKEIALFLFKKKIPAHVDMKDEIYYNGLIIEIQDSFIVLNDRMLGETLLAFSNIKNIDKFRGKLE